MLVLNNGVERKIEIDLNEGIEGAEPNKVTFDLGAQEYTHILKTMKHLKDNYPYLFSLGISVNPLNANASPVVTEPVILL